MKIKVIIEFRPPQKKIPQLSFGGFSLYIFLNLSLGAAITQTKLLMQ